MSNQPETNETPANGYTPAPRKVGLPRFFELLGRDLWAFYRASFLCLLGFLPGTALAVFGQMGGSALLTVLGGLLGGKISSKVQLSFAPCATSRATGGTPTSAPGNKTGSRVCCPVRCWACLSAVGVGCSAPRPRRATPAR